jgi:hypothetical protein
MSYFQRQDARLQEREPAQDAPRSPFSEVAGRFANWITGVDRIPPDERSADSYAEDRDPVGERNSGATESEEASRFPVAPFGYNRAAVDEHLIGLERELAELRGQDTKPPVSITEELERIGEQTASILVVAHDQANETTRLAQEQADRCVADAAANAVAITAQAKERLRVLDGETDSVWRERERLLDDVRAVSVALATLADDASERFPAAEQPPAAESFPMGSEPGATESFPMGSEPEATQSFRAVSEPPHAEPGDTAGWLAGLEPPDQQTP